MSAGRGGLALRFRARYGGFRSTPWNLSPPAMHSGRDSAGVVAPPPLIFLGGLALGIAVDVIADGSLPDGLWPLGLVLILAGVML